MDHPLTKPDNIDLRRRVIQLLASGYDVRREGNIVFVCGGNEPDHMRTRFREYCKSNHPEMEIFIPEFAMKDYFSTPDKRQFDIADFERLIADLSHAIVIFPEAAGSYAETGYFSALPTLSSKVILAMDSYWQGHDSFISMGPAKKINEYSNFYGTIQTPYKSPSFEDIIKRINRISFSRKRKTLKVAKFSELTTYEKFCLIHKIFCLLTAATIEDVIFILRGLFKSHLSVSDVKQLTSILVGAEYLREVGSYGHYCKNQSKGDLLFIRIGNSEEQSSIYLELASIYTSTDQEFREIIENSRDVD